MTDNTTIKTGAYVWCPSKRGDDTEAPWRVTDVARGWVSLECVESEATAKARAKQCTLLTDAEFEEWAPEGEETGRRMASTLERYKPKYEPCVAYSGAKSLNNGDDLAALLSGMTPQDTASLADRVLDVEPGFHFARYQSLNPGQIRMNSGNRIRAALRRGDVTLDDIAGAALQPDA